MSEIASMMPWVTHNLFDLMASIDYLLVAEGNFIFTKVLVSYTRRLGIMVFY